MVRAYSGCTIGRQTSNGPLSAGVMGATLGELDVNHPVYSMLLAAHRYLSALIIGTRSLIARIISAPFVSNIYHTVVGMLLAVSYRYTNLGIKAQNPRARFMGATLAANIHHAVLGMLLAARPRLSAFDVKVRIPRTANM